MKAEQWSKLVNDHFIKPALIVPFNKHTDQLCSLDLTASNSALTHQLLSDAALFAAYIDQLLDAHKARYAVGGYNEHRTIYQHSQLFDAAEADEEPRRLHLGTDIWGPAGTLVMAPVEGRVHSWGNNNSNGDYGGTLLLEHSIASFHFYTLYGHLSTASIFNQQKGKRITAGETIGAFGIPAENGNWAPHLHFQVILELNGREGDFPGVCRYSERETWLQICPDPAPLLAPLFE